MFKNIKRELCNNRQNRKNTKDLQIFDETNNTFSPQKMQTKRLFNMTLKKGSNWSKKKRKKLWRDESRIFKSESNEQKKRIRSKRLSLRSRNQSSKRNSRFKETFERWTLNEQKSKIFLKEIFLFRNWKSRIQDLTPSSHFDYDHLKNDSIIEMFKIWRDLLSKTF